MASLFDDITAFLAVHEMSETAFGTAALNDKNFVSDLRGGRSPSLNTAARVKEFMQTYRARAA